MRTLCVLRRVRRGSRVLKLYNFLISKCDVQGACGNKPIARVRKPNPSPTPMYPTSGRIHILFPLRFCYETCMFCWRSLLTKGVLKGFVWLTASRVFILEAKLEFGRCTTAEFMPTKKVPDVSLRQRHFGHHDKLSQRQLDLHQDPARKRAL